MCKPGLDGHDRGAIIVAKALRDAGFEVIYTGLHQTPEMIVNAALQEDVDLIGISILSGAHLSLVKEISKLMKKEKIKKPIFIGGIIPNKDYPKLKKMGVIEIFGPGTTTETISKKVKTILK